MATTCLLDELAIGDARLPEDLPAVRRLLRAYADWLQVETCLAGFERELAELPGAHAPPAGRLLLAKVAGEAVGIACLRPLAPGIGELRRLWVEPGWAGRGIGRRLTEAALGAARQIGYRSLRLDTIPARMPAAAALYRALGCRPLGPPSAAGIETLELPLTPP